MRAYSPKQLEALAYVAEGRMYPDIVREEDGWHARWLPLSSGPDDRALAGWVDEWVRTAAVTRLTEDAEDQRHETLHDAWLCALRSRTGLVRWDDGECAVFAEELRSWHGTVEEDAAARKGIVFRFDPSVRRLELTCAVPRGRCALRALGQAAFVFGPLRSLARRDADTLAVELRKEEFAEFLRTGARDLRDSGYGIEGVGIAAKISASADVGVGADDAASPVQARLVVRVAGKPVTAEEIRFLLEQHSSLVFFRDRWLEVDRNLLRQALSALERRGKCELTRNEALSFAFGLGTVGRLELDEVRAHGWVRGLLGEMRKRGESPLGEISCDMPGLVGKMRRYQARGVAWLRFMSDHGFGALLADEMGLGKTVQAIAWVVAGHGAGRAAKHGPALVVAPLTLLSNWRHELARFAPGLKVMVHQGERRLFGRTFVREAEAADVTVTSYSLLVRDYSRIREVKWRRLVLDEAQAIKNPDTRAALAVRSLNVPERLALTGTPIENSVADLWSIEEFLNPGFLGDRKSFDERFVKPIAADAHSSAVARLRHALEPFMLRRTKDTPEIAGELGAKREIREYCALTAVQRAQYEAALDDYRAGERHRGDVFALLVRLKLACDGAGKLERLVELLESIFAEGASALVFTQYARIGAWLQRELANRFGRTFPFLHGGLGVRQREAAIARFEEGGPAAPSAFILSLRSGGFGLNLVKATHVIHFDRWWNPAVENQATDRVHRIGQTRTVFVHLFITESTLEERIDELLERKSRIAGSLVTSGEGFLARLGAAEIEELVRLEDAP